MLFHWWDLICTREFILSYWSRWYYQMGLAVYRKEHVLPYLTVANEFSWQQWNNSYGVYVSNLIIPSILNWIILSMFWTSEHAGIVPFILLYQLRQSRTIPTTPEDHSSGPLQQNTWQFYAKMAKWNVWPKFCKESLRQHTLLEIYFWF